MPKPSPSDVSSSDWPEQNDGTIEESTRDRGGKDGEVRHYTVLATYGHMRDLPHKADAVKPELHFAMRWQMMPRAEERFRDIAAAVSR